MSNRTGRGSEGGMAMGGVRAETIRTYTRELLADFAAVAPTEDTNRQEDLARSSARLAIEWGAPLEAARLWYALGSRFVTTKEASDRIPQAIEDLTNAAAATDELTDPEAMVLRAAAQMYLAIAYSRLPVDGLERVGDEILGALSAATGGVPETVDAEALRLDLLAVWGDVLANSVLGPRVTKALLRRIRKIASPFEAEARSPERGFLAIYASAHAAARLGYADTALRGLKRAAKEAATSANAEYVGRSFRDLADQIRSQGGPGAAIEAAGLQTKAGSAFQSAGLSTPAADVFRTAGVLYLEHGRWADGAEAFQRSIIAADASLDEALLDPEVRQRLSRRSLTHQALTLCLARLGDGEAAVEAADRARAWRLRSMPRIGDPAFAFVAEHAPDLATAYLEVQRQIRAAEIEEQRVRLSLPESIAESLGGLANLLATLRRERAAIRDQMRAVPGAAEWFAPVTISRIRSALPTESAAVYIISSPYGGVGLAVTADKVKIIPLPDLTNDAISERIATIGRLYDPVHAGYPAATLAWDEGIDQVGKWLWVSCMGPILDAVPGLDRLILIAGGGLDFLPLHAAWRVTNGAREYAVDRLAISYAPCADLQPTAGASVAFRDQDALIVGNPLPTSAPTLQGAALEAEAIAPAFARVALREGPEATSSVVAEILGEADVVHLACHGYTDFGTPYASFVLMACDYHLTVSDIVDTTLPRRPSVFLSACETGLHDIENADEVQSLSSAFLAAGARDVISTLWTVDDASSIAMASMIYDARFRGVSGAEAVREAQRWLRDTPNDEKATAIEALKWMTDQARAVIGAMLRASTEDHSRPRHWAPHVYSGA